jgi:GH15 family glucan-1,4-alpha-glucosidase
MRTTRVDSAKRIEDYALIGNCETTALVGKNGSIDWLGLPRYDSLACFAALLGNEENGRWLIAPKHEKPSVKRKYRDGALVLETEFTTPEGKVVVIDCMDRQGNNSDVIRLVRGLSGNVPMRMELIIRFDMGWVAPWVTRLPDRRLRAVGGPDQLILDCPIEVEGRDLTTVAEFSVAEGQEIGFSLRWAHSWHAPPKSPDVRKSLEQVTESWQQWAKQFKGAGEWSDPVLRSLVTLKALAHHATGGIVAAATTSLPEWIGGTRNWDYRYCWLRDATFTLYSLMSSGFLEEAKAWRQWLVRAVAGSQDKMQIMYGVGGERRLTEFEVNWLCGFDGSKPVRVGNAASEQMQLDVYGEVVDMLYQARRYGLDSHKAGWALQKAMVSELEGVWARPDHGIWEVRGGPKQFTHSKVMAWVAVDRAVRGMEEFGDEGPLDEWRALRAQIHESVCKFGFNKAKNSFVQSFGSEKLDASLLMLPLVGFLPANDPRILGTVAAIERELVNDDLVSRYRTDDAVDGIQEPEGVFLACTFWLVDNYIMQGRRDDGERLFRKLLGLCNDVGLLSEEYDPVTGTHLGNFPQAFSHVSLVNTAHNLTSIESPAERRARRGRGNQNAG